MQTNAPVARPDYSLSLEQGFQRAQNIATEKAKTSTRPVWVWLSPGTGRFRVGRNSPTAGAWNYCRDFIAKATPGGIAVPVPTETTSGE